jgi:hypothetical protein
MCRSTLSLSLADTSPRSVNGICTSPSGLRLIQTWLQDTFHRPVTGLNNRTFGFWFDFLECLVQRDLFWPTQDLRTGYKVRRRQFNLRQRSR